MLRQLYKKLFDVGQREIIFLFTLINYKGEHSIFCQNNKHWHDREGQGSPNQAKWATSSPWFQWSRPISVKTRSFSRPVSLFKSIFFSPISILFLQYSHKRLPCSWNVTHTGFDVQYFIPNSLIASFLTLKIIVRFCER
jgi:hypothetical protein